MAEPLDADVFAAMVNEMRSPLPLELTVRQAMVLVNQLRLALQHPANNGPSAQIAHDLAMMFTAMVGALPGPIRLELMANQVVVLLGQLQLALWHPTNTGRPAQIAHDLATMFQAALQMQNPAIEPYLNASWEETPL